MNLERPLRSMLKKCTHNTMHAVAVKSTARTVSFATCTNMLRWYDNHTKTYCKSSPYLTNHAIMEAARDGRKRSQITLKLSHVPHAITSYLCNAGGGSFKYFTIPSKCLFKYAEF